MKKIIQTLLIIGIVILAFFLRIYNVSSIPPALSWDEVSIGYNAFSILKTGRDEHGKFLPVDVFVAYGDYKPPLAVYLTVPSIAVFGLNELGVRLPSVLFGTLTVLFTYFLVKELFDKSKYRYQLSVITAALLVFSPWHINLSRAGFEANIALFFIVLGVYAIIVASRKPAVWIVAWMPFVAAIYTFNSARYFAPLFGLALCVYFRKQILSHWKQFLLGGMLAGVLMIPIVPHLLSKESRLRFEEVNIFTDASVVATANDRIAYDNGSFIGKMLHNRRVGYTLSYLRHFADNLQPSFLFIQGDGNPKFSTRAVGQLYMIEAPLLVIGIIAMFVTYRQIAWMLLLWLIFAIVPAATARETPHALRILNSLPTWQIFIAYGITTCIQYVHAKTKKRMIHMGIFVVFIFLYIFNVGYYLHNYYAHYAKTYSGEWQYGYKEAIQEAVKIENNYDTIYLSSSIGRPYMYTLFYSAYDPNAYRNTKDAVFDTAGFYHVYGFGRYRFIDRMPVGPLKQRTLYIADPGWVPDGVRIVKKISLLDGTERLVLFDKP